MTDEFGLLDALRSLGRSALRTVLLALSLPLLLVAIGTACVMVAAVGACDVLAEWAQRLRD